MIPVYTLSIKFFDNCKTHLYLIFFADEDLENQFCWIDTEDEEPVEGKLNNPINPARRRTRVIYS